MRGTKHNDRYHGGRRSRFEIIALLLGLALIVSQAIGVVGASAGTGRDRSGTFQSDTTKVTKDDTTKVGSDGGNLSTRTRDKAAAPAPAATDALNVDLDQWANLPGQGWQNGDLNGSNSAYNEGDVVPFRLALEGLAAGTHQIHLNYDFTAGGVEAYDFLATWNASESPGLCDAGGGAVSSMCPSSLGSADTKAFPSDPFEPGAEASTQTASGLTVAGAEAFSGVPRDLTMYGGSITSITGPTHNGPVDNNSTGDFVVTFDSTGSAVLFAWGGHLAESAYWKNLDGGNNGASVISGAPWHMRTKRLDGSGSKNQDRSIQPSAIVPLPGLDIVKSASSSQVGPAETFTYTITVSNTGDATASPVIITDDLDDSLTGVTATYDIDPASGQDGTCTVDSGNTISCPSSGTISLAKNDGDQTAPENDVVAVTITATAPTESCPTLLNTASAQIGTQAAVTSNQVTVDVTGCGVDLSLTKDSDVTASADPGDSASFSIVATNNGTVTAHDVSVTDTVPDGLTIDGATFTGGSNGPGTCDVNGQDVSCDIGSLAAGASATVTIDVTVTAGACPSITNTATVSASNETGSTEDNSDTASFDVTCPVNLTLDKSADAQSVNAGDSFTYTIDVANDGQAAATNVHVTDSMPAGVTIDDATFTGGSNGPGTCDVNGQDIDCDLGTLAAGASAQVTIDVTVDSSACPSITNNASVSTDNETGSTEDNSDSVTVSVACAVSVGVVKSNDANTDGAFSDTETASAAGQAVDFEAVITNTSQVPVTITSLTDAWPGHDASDLTCDDGEGGVDPVGTTLAPDESLTCHFTEPDYAPPAGESLTDTVVVAVESNSGGADASDTSTVNTPGTPPPPPPPAPLGIQIIKSGPALAHIGDTITYTFDVSLTTATPLTGITVTDPICSAAPTLDSKSGGDQDEWLESGETWHYSCTHEVTDADPDPLPNTATVRGTDSLGRSTSDTDDHLVDIIHPAIKIVKTADPTSIGPGETVTYTYEVTNIGDVTLYNVSVDDDKLGHICDIAQLDVGQTETCTKDFTAGQSNLGPLDNVAVAEGEDETGYPVRDDDKASIDVVLGTTVTPTKTPPGGTAFTGSNVLPLGAVALVFLVIGTGLVYLGRRREDGSEA